MRRRKKVHKTQGDIIVRSGFEADVLDVLDRNNVKYEYETIRVPYTTHHHYIPDIVLGNGVVVELKGRFLSADRSKILNVRRNNPHLDLRMVFYRANEKLRKGSKTSYGDWCDQHNIKWAEHRIPLEWINE